MNIHSSGFACTRWERLLVSSARTLAFRQCVVCPNQPVLISYPGFSSMFSFLPLTAETGSQIRPKQAVRAKFDEEESDQLEAEKPNAFFARSEEANC